MISARFAAKSERPVALPTGVALKPLKTHPDSRGDFTEFFRGQWHDSPLPVQWSVVRSDPNVLRGVHVHARHWDYVCVISGGIVIGLHDLRPRAPCVAQSAIVWLDGGQLEILVIPPGVAHGFYSTNSSTHVIGASSYYDPSDHRRCRWDCPELALDWPCSAPDLSPADRDAPGYAELKTAFLAATAIA